MVNYEYDCGKAVYNRSTYKVEAQELRQQYSDGDGHLVTHTHGATKSDGRDLRYVHRNSYCVDTCVNDERERGEGGRETEREREGGRELNKILAAKPEHC